MACAINPSRTGGVDVELPPFGTVRLHRTDSPKRRFGCVGEGAYVEFEAYPNEDEIMLQPYVGPSKNAAVIVTSKPLSLCERNPEYVTRPWWLVLWDRFSSDEQ